MTKPFSELTQGGGASDREMLADSRARRNESLASISMEALSERDPKRLMDFTVGHLAETFGLTHILVARYEAEVRQVYVLSGHGWQDGFIGTRYELIEATHSSFILQTGEPVVVEDYGAQTRVRPAPVLVQHGISSGITVAIRINGVVWGFLAVFDRMPHRYSENDLHYVQAVANVLSIAIERSNSERALLEEETARLEAEQRRLESERALFEKERHLQKLISSSGVGIVFTTRDGILTDANDAFLKMIGYSREELDAAKPNWVDLTPPEYRDISMRRARELQETGECIPFEKKYRHRDGHLVDVLLTSVRLDPPDDRYLTFVLDVSHQKRTERILQESEGRFQNLADTAPMYMAMADETGQAIYFNKPWLQATGRTMDEMRGLGWLCTLHPEDRPLFEAAFRDAFARQAPIREEYRFRMANGEYRWMLAVGAPRFSPDGEFIGYFGTYTDFHDLKQTQIALMESEARFRTMSDSAPVLIWTAGVDGLCDYFSKPWLDYTGRPLEAEIGHGWAQGVHPDDLDYCMETYLNALERREEFEMEYRLRRHDGEYRWMLDHGTPRYSQEQFIGYIGSCIDITDRKLAEARINRMFASNIIGVLHWRTDGLILHANDYFLNLLGYTREELKEGKIDWEELTPPEFHHLDQAALESLTTTGMSTPFEKQYIAKDGSRIDILLGTAMFEGSDTEGVAYILDIRDRKKTELALARRLQEESLISDLLKTISQSFSPAEILQEAAGKVGAFYGVNRCTVVQMQLRTTESGNNRYDVKISGQYTSDPQYANIDLSEIPRDILTFLTTNMPERYITQPLVSTSQEAYEQEMLERLREMNLPEGEFDRYRKETHRLTFDRYRIKSVLRVGITYRGRAYGTIGLHQCDRERAWTEDELALLQTVAEHIGNALFQAELYQQEESTRRDLESTNNLLNIISSAQNHFITNEDIYSLFEEPLEQLLGLTQSDYGFIGEILRKEDGTPYLKCNFLTNIAWNEETRALYEASLRTGLEFHALDNLFGRVITTGQVVISNDPANDPRRAPAGRPQGHPPLNAFLGIPFSKDGKLLGMIGIANRPGGYDMKLVEYLQPFITACGNIIAGHRNERMREELTLELKRNERSLKLYATRLEQSNQELEHFAAVASHDLQAPLRKVQIFADQLKNSLGDKLDPVSEEYMDRMHRATRRMQNLITDLLILSRVTRKGNPFKQVDLARVMAEVRADLEDTLQETGGVIEAGEMPSLDADATQMHQLLQNLVENGLKFCPPGRKPVVKVNAVKEDNLCRITVTDNGIGFKEEYCDRIFEVFERLHPDSDYSGTGIGLAICRKIAERHGGTISASSKPGEGSTFTILLPVRQEPAETEPAKA